MAFIYQPKLTYEINLFKDNIITVNRNYIRKILIIFVKTNNNELYK